MKPWKQVHDGTRFVTADGTVMHSTVATPLAGAPVLQLDDWLLATDEIDGMRGHVYYVTDAGGLAVVLVKDDGSAAQAVRLQYAGTYTAWHYLTWLQRPWLFYEGDRRKKETSHVVHG